MSAEKAIARLRAKVKRGVTKACSYLQTRIRINLSVPAKRKTVVSRSSNSQFGPVIPGAKYKVAATPATFGAFPRKVTGNLRRSVVYEVIGTNPDEIRGRVGTRLDYGYYLEQHDHWWLGRTYDEEETEIVDIIMDEMRR